MHARVRPSPRPLFSSTIAVFSSSSHPTQPRTTLRHVTRHGRRGWTLVVTPSFPEKKLSGCNCTFSDVHHRRHRHWREAHCASPTSGSTMASFLATCAPGDEMALHEEVMGPHVRATWARPTRGGVHFGTRRQERKAMAVGYRACLWLRTSLRVLHLVHEGPLPPARNRLDAVHAFTRNATDWNAQMPNKERTVGVRVAARKDAIATSAAVTHAVKSCCDARSTKSAEAALPLWFATTDDGMASIHRDLCGVSLHQRGYRDGQGSHRAALRATAAARCLKEANWRSKWTDHVLVDPMCGAGTMLVEAAQQRMNMAPGQGRREWPFQEWPDFDAEAWDDAWEEATEARDYATAQWRRSGAPPILGADHHPRAVDMACDTVRQAGLEEWISIQRADCCDWPVRETIGHQSKCMVLTNPPWGMRLGGEGPEREKYPTAGQGQEQALAEESWIALRTFLKQNCSKSDAYILCGNPAMSKHLRMRTERKYPIATGGTDCRLLHYKVF